MQPLRYVFNHMPTFPDPYSSLLSSDEVARVRAFHQSFPQYSVTPLCALPTAARALGVAGLYVKDESYRFGLNAFKVLGGSYAMARSIARALNRPIERTDYAYLASEAFKRDYGQATFFTATDGNHGRGVAWAARVLGQRAVVHMPKGTAVSRFDNIVKEGATVSIEEMNYDDCVRLAAREAAQTERGVVIQDTAWPGYEEIPSWIMQGYGTMADEAHAQLNAFGVDRPTHIFVQAGVGSLAGAVQAYFAQRFPDHVPVTIVLEADAADCHYRSALAGDGTPRAVKGDLSTMMAGLACGEVNPISWSILRCHAACFLSCPDWVSALGMRMLGAPLGDDSRVISGESGAVGMGALAVLMHSPAYGDLRAGLNLNEKSQVLLFSTEGDTDPQHYQAVLWGGAQPCV